MGAMACQITSLKIVYSAVYSHTDQRKHQSSTSLAFVCGIHRGPVHSPHKWPVTRKMFPFHVVEYLDWYAYSIDILWISSLYFYSSSTASNEHNFDNRNIMSIVNHEILQNSKTIYVYDAPFITTTKLYMGPLYNNHSYVVVKLIIIASAVMIAYNWTVQ